MNRLIFILFSFNFLGFQGLAQELTAAKLSWKVNRIDLGTLLEEQGLQAVSFDYTVSHGSYFVIQEVLTDCGCTQVTYAKDSMKVGDTGQIKVDFDPSSAAGFFSKLILVKGNQGQVTDSLFIEGIAIPYPASLERNYPNKLGNLGLRMKKVNMGDVFDNEPKVKFVEFFNFGTQLLSKDSLRFGTPTHLSLAQVQDFVRPKERGLLRITYDAKLRPELGAVSDSVWINWSGRDEEKIEFEILANLFDFFIPIPKSDFGKVPQLNIDQKVIDLGEISAEVIQRQQVILTNLGKEPLEIRKVQENCTCLLSEFPKSILLPEEKMELNLVFDPVGRKGIDQRNIYIFTNDPVNPVQLIQLKSRIE